MAFDPYAYYSENLEAMDPPLSPNSPVDRVVVAILRDVTDRRSWRQEWDMFDEDVRGEIIQTWREKTAIALATTDE